VFVVVFIVYFVMTQSGNLWIHPRTSDGRMVFLSQNNFLDHPVENLRKT